ncbi:FAD-binding and (Fe-S)-binding domain-containing protein [Nocardia vermiculata]|uniref:FAD-binding oxidoreductase n=1 Tax=Nocardia vermiculata TaxID=257274 RepID=A0A846Y2L1_9NOCA|nr:FAD-binding and (Fe-S)-binding domain-containing protein [Nocardia vermiculata]NKY53746.1 FAD-binding oxidoreductase [Nocardia vermiculata]
MTDSWMRDLRDRIDGDVEAGPRRRVEYSSDASNYRVRPAAVVYPRADTDVAQVLRTARDEGLSVTARGGGTSVAGNAIGPGIVLDFSRHLNRVLAMDPGERCARVQPGVVLSQLQAAAAPHGLRLGPDPSTQNRCTLGGMIGNNACGPHAVSWGRTSDTVRELRILDGTGAERTLGTDLSAVPGLPEFTTDNLAALRTELGRFDRQASGYGLHYLTPERGGSIAKAFVGSEGSCGLVLDATVELVPIPPVTVLAVLGYPDMPTAADDVRAVLAGHPTAVEGLDARLVDVVRAHGRPVPDLPAGGAWLFVEFAGETTEAARESANSVVSACGALDTLLVTEAATAARLWRIRADGAGLAGRTPSGEPAWPGWEDAAVPPERLGDYLRDFEALMRDHRVDGLLYGHIGDGCIHVRLDLPIARAPQRFRDFLYDATDLVVRYGGSASGEHGDGRARSELLSRMYSPAALRVFEEFKGLFDPDEIMNPGILVRPRPVDADLRLAGLAPVPAAGGFALGADGGDIGTAVHRCVGVGKCRADTRSSGGFMCPSYLATADEKDSTRGRARVLQEVVRGTLDWRADAVAESLDLCLSCRACASDCPAGVDMATYKSETLYRAYRHRLRPIDHYVLGQLPRWLALGTRMPRAVNALTGARWLRELGMRAAGMDPRRPAPRLAPQSFRDQWARREQVRDARPVAMLWIDSFTDAFAPDIGWAAVELVESAGYRVRIPARRVCCGLTWISTGQLDGARRRLRHTLGALDEHIRAGGPVIGLEPSCTAALRSDLPELLPDDPRSAPTAAAVRTLAEFLDGRPEWHPPDRSGDRVLVQPHCHQHAVSGFDADLRVLQRTGAEITEISGCCGLAGNFGMQAGHYDISVAVAEGGILPALRAARSGTTLLADGFSCRTQAEQLAGRSGRHLAQYLSGERP